MNPRMDAETKETTTWEAALLEVIVGTACVPVIVKIGLVVATKLPENVVTAVAPDTPADASIS